MQRFWIEKTALQQDHVRLTGATYHHICRVCRIEVGEHFELLAEDHKAYLVQMQSVGKKEATAKIIEQRQVEAPAQPQLHLALAFARPYIMDRVIEKSVELGVHSVQLFTSAKSQQLKNLKTPRWEKIIHTTMAQCGRAHKMQLSTAKNLEECFVNFKNPLSIVAYEKANDLSKTGGQQNFSLKLFLQQGDLKNVQDVLVFVGPEGGFVRPEIDLLIRQGVQPVSLGRQILKVETACIALIGILNYELGRM